MFQQEAFINVQFYLPLVGNMIRTNIWQDSWRDRQVLVAAGVVLRRHENQAGSRFDRPQLLLGCPAASLQDSDDSRISREHANSNGERNRKAENQRHEERNHNQPPFTNWQ